MKRRGPGHRVRRPGFLAVLALAALAALACGVAPCAGGASPAPASTPDAAPPTIDLALDPLRFVHSLSNWDSIGPQREDNPDISLEGGTRVHAFGRIHGQMAYAFDLPAARFTGASVEALLSSEFPGFEGPADGQTTVRLVVNGKPYDARTVASDNGAGTRYRWSVDPEHLRPGQNTVAFEVPADAKQANGLCVYGRSVRPATPDGAVWIRVTTASRPAAEPGK